MRQNIAFPLTHGEDEKREADIAEGLETAGNLDLTNLLDRKPQLSGGQRQRGRDGQGAITCAIPASIPDGRAAVELDAVRVQMRGARLPMQRRHGYHRICVCGRPGAMTLGDRVVVMATGGITGADRHLRALNSTDMFCHLSFIGSPEAANFFLPGDAIGLTLLFGER